MNRPRRYKPGFSPEELTREPIAATCGACGQDTLLIYPAGAVCSTCSPNGLGKLFSADMDRRRVADGHMPASELIGEDR